MGRLDDGRDREDLERIGAAIGYGRAIQILQLAWNAANARNGFPPRFNPDGSLALGDGGPG